MKDPIVTKEYVDGGVNISTTTIEFVPTDVLDSRLLIAQQTIQDAQEVINDILGDKNNIDGINSL